MPSTERNSIHVSLGKDDRKLVERLRDKHRNVDGARPSVSAIVRMAIRKMAGAKRAAR